MSVLGISDIGVIKIVDRRNGVRSMKYKPSMMAHGFRKKPVSDKVEVHTSSGNGIEKFSFLIGYLLGTMGGLQLASIIRSL